MADQQCYFGCSRTYGLTKVTKEVAFVVTRQNTAGLRLNIVPVSIGPQISGSSEKTQKVNLTLDWEAKAQSNQAAVK